MKLNIDASLSPVSNEELATDITALMVESDMSRHIEPSDTSLSVKGLQSEPDTRLTLSPSETLALIVIALMLDDCFSEHMTLLRSSFPEIGLSLNTSMFSSSLWNNSSEFPSLVISHSFVGNLK